MDSLFLKVLIERTRSKYVAGTIKGAINRARQKETINKGVMGISLNRPTHELVITNIGTDTPSSYQEATVTYGTWDPVLAGAFINFGHFTLALSSAIAEEGDEATSTQEFRGSYWHKYFGVTAGFAYQKNFQITESTGFDNLATSDKRRTDMEYQSGTLQVTYVLMEFGLHQC